MSSEYTPINDRYVGFKFKTKDGKTFTMIDTKIDDREKRIHESKKTIYIKLIEAYQDYIKRSK